MNAHRIPSIPLAVRVYPVPSTSKERTVVQRTWCRPESMLVFDTETTIDATQRLLFGCYRFIDQGQCKEEGLFYADDLATKDLKTLQCYAAKHHADTVDTGYDPA